MTSLLLSAFIYLASAAVAVPLSKRLGLGSVLGYLIAGVLIGPVFGLVGQETESIQHVAEFGVVMMLFLVGLELEPHKLWQLRWQLRRQPRHRPGSSRPPAPSPDRSGRRFRRRASGC